MEFSENRTKRDLDDALRQLLEQKPLEQIRVREVTALCGIRRQSFYYHFSDVYALYTWSLRQETVRLLARQESCLTWQQALLDLLGHTRHHQTYYQALLRSRGRAGFREVLGAALEPMLEQTLDYYRRRCGGEKVEGQADCCEMLLLTLLESWVQDELSQEPGAIIALLEGAVQQSIMGAAWQNLSMKAAN